MSITDPQDEIFPLVNERGEIIGKTTRREAHSNPALIHPVVGIFVFNPRGGMLLQKRSAQKDLNPNCWTISVGGHMHYGDTPVEAAVREAKEEIGLEIDAERLHPLGEGLKRNTKETEYWYGFRYDLLEDVTLVAHPDEVAELRFVPLDELRRMMRDPSVLWAADPKRLIQAFILAP
ncbi:hypothetical protein A3J43_03925 [Candidatus Uhrbacteria bacterium RIFCSPHIGHO2_12_FULL_54_23]|uniref:Nudix hydrolase domain-containing protein n=1 Tax=Candidatus Uhrbacteria bacterium RIFCSPHIGHO2_12_FULL_54_23 TaxID=1802397 RepID=A0A1F7ULA6_9BACT|nr:MAG: hypothetical protein A3J43_03925 [Candidatus Uhrbacteria bacterium RIFCSPHIGHO2_12_FULL_54_23]